VPIIAPAPPTAGLVIGLVTAAPGCTVTVGQVSGPVVAWVQIADARALGGARLDPVWVAGGRAWTPDQYRAATGVQAAVTITAP
jgi:hypothetical protein